MDLGYVHPGNPCSGGGMFGEKNGFVERVRGELKGRERQTLREEGLKCAAVLVPLLFKDGEWHVAVTQRTNEVEHHKGQISFPGGACEPGDADRLATALRETFEEIGVPPEAVEVLGALDDFRTITHFAVTPFVGVIPHPFPYRLSAWEVADVVEVPLSFLCDEANLRAESVEHEGQVYEVLFWDYQAYTIWGATARMLKGLLEMVCFTPPLPPPLGGGEGRPPPQGEG